MNGIKKGFSTVNYSSDSSSSVFIILQDWFSDAKCVERTESILNDDLPFSQAGMQRDESHTLDESSEWCKYSDKCNM